MQSWTWLAMFLGLLCCSPSAAASPVVIVTNCDRVCKKNHKTAAFPRITVVKVCKSGVSALKRRQPEELDPVPRLHVVSTC